MSCGENQPTFQRNILAPSLWPKNTPTKKAAKNKEQITLENFALMGG
jgi:hypothetical protein